MSKNFTDNQELENALILKIVYMALGITSFYALCDIFILKKYLVLHTSYSIFGAYAICLALYRLFNSPALNKRVFAFMLLVGGFLSFIFLDGFKAPTSLDICSMVLILVLLYSGVERIVYLGLAASMILFCIYVQLYHPEYIVDAFANDYFLLDFFEILARLILIGILAWVVRQKHDKERALASSYNLELFNKNEEITQLNLQLEALLAKKTENIYDLHAKIDYYSFLNSHRIRGPLASILGLTYLSKYDLCTSSTFDKEILMQYIEMLETSALDLDTILKEANVILARE